MFVKTTRVQRHNNKTYEYLSLVEAVREVPRSATGCCSGDPDQYVPRIVSVASSGHPAGNCGGRSYRAQSLYPVTEVLLEW